MFRYMKYKTMILNALMCSTNVLYHCHQSQFTISFSNLCVFLHVGVMWCK